MGRVLRLDLTAPALVHWSTDAWETRKDTWTKDTGLGVHAAEIATDGLVPGRQIVFTWMDLATGEWIGQDYSVTVSQG